MSEDWQRQDEAVQMMLNRLDVASTGLYMTGDELKLRELCGAAAEMIRKMAQDSADLTRAYTNCAKRKGDYKREATRLRARA